ncbi:hypothetical protein WNY81_09405 [Shewanella frigidimarina]|uniref:hypothetical protein n=1 Tax=Shewanella frigidimarina TaxID=56812 RepID=UPI00316DB956
MFRIILLFIFISLTGCVNYQRPADKAYFGGNINTKEDAESYYGISSRKISQNTFEIFVVMPSGHNRDKLLRQIIADKAGELCSDKVEIQVEGIETHGKLNPTRFAGNWLSISQRAILKCEKQHSE